MAGYDFEFYETGTISVTAGQKAFTGSGTAWKLRGCEGALVVVAGAGTVNFVSSLSTDAAGEFRTEWAGPDLVDASYVMWLPSAVAATALANHQRLADIIASIQTAQPASNILAALAALHGVDGKIPVFSGQDTFRLESFIADPKDNLKDIAALPDVLASMLALLSTSIATGSLSVKPNGVGGVTLSPGDAGLPGYVSFHSANGTRRGYIGWGDSNYNLLQGENGWGFMVPDNTELRVKGPNQFDRPLKVRTGAAWSQTSLQEYGWATGFTAWRSVIENDGGYSLYSYNPNDGNIIGQGIYLSQSGNLSVRGTISKGGGTLLTDHPLDPMNKNIRYGFTEGARYYLVHVGEAEMVDGRATVDIDTAFDMMPGTFAAMNQNALVVSLNHQSSFDRVKNTPISGSTFDIICENDQSSGTVVWTVIGERADAFVRNYDPNCERGSGKFIPEFEKPDYVEPQNA